MVFLKRNFHLFILISILLSGFHFHDLDHSEVCDNFSSHCHCCMIYDCVISIFSYNNDCIGDVLSFDIKYKNDEFSFQLFSKLWLERAPPPIV